LDYLDVSILKKLSENCRTPFEALAREMGVTSTAIKKRIRKLLKEDKLKNFAISLSFSTIGADRIIILITTNGNDDRESMKNKIGVHPLIERVCCLSDGRYLVHAVCCETSELIQLDHFFREFLSVLSIEMHPLESPRIPRKKRDNITRMQLEIMECLQSNPRMESSKVADAIHRSAKGVRMAIKRLIDSGLVIFSVQCDFSMYFVKVRRLNSRDSLEEINSLISRLFPSAWEIVMSSIKPDVFISFAIERLDEISNIQRRLRKSSSLMVLEETVCESNQFFKSIRDEALDRLIANSGREAKFALSSSHRELSVSQTRP
jgi:DNA-binding Lrp family transcriptional regulator